MASGGTGTSTVRAKAGKMQLSQSMAGVLLLRGCHHHLGKIQGLLLKYM